MKEIIKHYKTLLTCDQFVITGSYALSLMGLVEPSKVGDLDLLLVNPTDETKNILERLQKESPAKTSPSGGSVQFIFMHDKTKVDVFFDTKKIDSDLFCDGVQVNIVSNIISAKRKANRMKDWVQLRRIAGKVFNQSEFTAFLDKQ